MQNDDAPPNVSPQEVDFALTFPIAEELFISTSPHLENVRQAIDTFLVANDPARPKTLHQLMSDKNAKSSFRTHSFDAGMFIQNVENETDNINDTFPEGSLMPEGTSAEQENSTREALAEFIACLEFIAWKNNSQNGLIKQSINEQGVGFGKSRSEKTINLFTAETLKSFIDDGGDPQKQGLAKFVREWHKYDFIEKASNASFILGKLLAINTPTLIWQKKYWYKEVTNVSRSVVTVPLTGSIITKKIQSTITPTNIFNLTPAAAENQSSPLQIYIAQAKRLWPKLHQQKTTQIPYPSFRAAIPVFHQESWPRNPDRSLVKPEEPKVDPEFWRKLLHGFSNASSEDAQIQSLLNEVCDDKIIPSLKTLNEAEQQTLRPMLLRLFACLQPEHLVDLTESARGRLLHIKKKFNLPLPPDYLFTEHGRFDPYPHQQMVDNMGVYVKRLETRVEDKDPVVMQLLDKDALNALSDIEKQKLLEIMVDECATALGISPAPKVVYESTSKPPLIFRSDMYPPTKQTSPTAYTTYTIPAKITFGPAIFKRRTSDLINIVAHETEHANQFNLRRRINSTQSNSPNTSFPYRFQPKQKLPKHSKYRENVVQARFEGIGTIYHSLFGNELERRGHCAGLAAEIFAERSKVFNPNQEGILCQFDPANAGSDIMLAYSQFLSDKVKVSEPDIAMRPYFFAPVNNVTTFTPVSARDAYEALEASRPAHSKRPEAPTILQLSKSHQDLIPRYEHAFHAAMPQIFKKAQDTKDPACVQSRLVLTKDNPRFPQPRVAEFPPMEPAMLSASLDYRLRSLGKDYPDDFSRLWVAHKFSEATKVPVQELLEKINSVQSDVQKTAPFTAAKALEKEIGVSMREMELQFSIFGGTPFKPVEKTLNDFLKLQEHDDKADEKSYGMMAMIFGLRSRIMGLDSVTVDDEHPAHNKAVLLEQMITSAIVRRIDNTAPTVEQALKEFFEKKHDIQFATSEATCDKAYLDNLTKLAQIYSNKMCNEVIAHVACTAAGLGRDSPIGNKIDSTIRSVTLSAVSSEKKRKVLQKKR